MEMYYEWINQAVLFSLQVGKTCQDETIPYIDVYIAEILEVWWKAISTPV